VNAREPTLGDPEANVATAQAHTNIALVKYWGKRDEVLNLPAVGSLSMTLDGLWTETRVTLGPGLETDTFCLDGQAQDGLAHQRVAAFLGLVREVAGRTELARVESRNHVPTAAGLASSASGFAALAVAAAAAYGLRLSPAELSALARRGSASAARSLFGGLVVMERGVREDGGDCVARPLESPGPGWDLGLVVATCAAGPKDVGSRDGMGRTARTSPYHAAWVATHQEDLHLAVEAAGRRDLAGLGEVVEHSTLKMHADAMAARPGILYWRGATVEAFHAVRGLRASGVGAWATMDAGPHVKVLCAPPDAPRVEQALRAVTGVLGVTCCGLGPAARLLP
jgi:diphosphomevalonate decarboxylase